MSAPKKYQTVMLAFYFCNNTLGIICGYEVVSLMKTYPGFQYAFLIPGILLSILCPISFLFFDKKHFIKGSKFDKLKEKSHLDD